MPKTKVKRTPSRKTVALYDQVVKTKGSMSDRAINLVRNVSGQGPADRLLKARQRGRQTY